MTERTVKIEDDLDEIIEGLKEEILDNFKEYFNDNTGMSDFDQYYQAQGCDLAHEASDSWTPIYYSHIDGLYYLYGNEFDEAYSNAGIGDGNEDNHRQVAIYCYISDKGFEYQKEIETAFDEWLADGETEEGSGKMPWDYLG
ncbi:hypothetical protein LCGC14_0561070 [marine sediment metagenome]|uniref:Uncharacterized protein n=1 Tax=marine sediment metagenome TaxID=412755 RepID=A0A0F9U8H5_9ZZZZ